MASVKNDDRVIFVPEAAQRTEDHDRAIRMQALAELRALNETRRSPRISASASSGTHTNLAHDQEASPT
jgi:hypothetical protein